TMAGKGSEMGVNLEEISKIINSVRKKDQIGVCLDTCHLHDAGYELGNVDLFLDKVDEIIGLKYIKVIHINDSMNPIGAHKDRHENIGYGHIGFNIINDFVHNSRLSDIPKILETPWVGEKEPYKKEIEMLLSSTFEEGWREKL
ncbi:MAG: deoxyribonuclease IV, partial [Bacilli bacterium]|nr:deoxyribonuclease IV [Bacilli bacterium]